MTPRYAFYKTGEGIRENGLGLSWSDFTFTITGLEVGRTFSFGYYLNNPSSSISLIDTGTGFTTVSGTSIRENPEGVCSIMRVAITTDSIVTLHLGNSPSDAQIIFMAYQA